MSIQWVKFKNRAPSDEKYKILYNDSDGMRRVAMGFYSYFSKSWIGIPQSWHSNNITHWMDLPEKPEL